MRPPILTLECNSPGCLILNRDEIEVQNRVNGDEIEVQNCEVGKSFMRVGEIERQKIDREK